MECRRNASNCCCVFVSFRNNSTPAGTTASQTRRPTDRAPCPPRTDNPNTRPEPSERQQKNAPHSQEPRQKHQQTKEPERIPETVTRSDHAEPIRAEMLTDRRSHSPRSHHKTRRGFNRCIHGQTTTAEENAPQNAIHGAGANRANLPHWTESRGTPTEHARSHIEPFLLILRTFTHRQIKHA